MINTDGSKRDRLSHFSVLTMDSPTQFDPSVFNDWLKMNLHFSLSSAKSLRSATHAFQW